jgi:hypothetical protein
MNAPRIRRIRQDMADWNRAPGLGGKEAMREKAKVSSVSNDAPFIEDPDFQKSL